MRASEIANRPVDVKTALIVLRGAEVFTLTFDASKVTRYWAANADSHEGVLGFYDALLEVVTGWDVTNDDGTPYELTVDNMAALRLSFDDELHIIKQIVQAAQPSSEEGNASSDTSSTPEPVSMPPQASHPNGQEPSPSQTPSTSPSPT